MSEPHPSDGPAGPLSPDQFRTVKKLVSQVSRAFFSPPYVIVMEKLMTKDVWLDIDLATSLGFTKNTETFAFCRNLEKQRLIKMILSHERNPLWDPSLRRGKQTVKRAYWYIDYKEFVLATRYRLGVIGKKLEDRMRVPKTDTPDYLCPLCHKTYQSIDIPSLMHILPSSSSSINLDGEFQLICDSCGTEIIANEEGLKKEEEKNEGLIRFNKGMDHVMTTLREIAGMRLDEFDVEEYLLRNIPSTIRMEIDERGRKRLPEDVREESALIQATTEEEEVERMRKEAEKAEKQRLADSLPVWHTQSTVSGAETALGITHKDQDKRAVERSQAAMREKQRAVDQEADDELEAYYASIQAESENDVEEEEAEDDDDEDMEEMETGPISISTPIIDSGVPVANGVGLGAASGSGSGTGSSPGMGSVGSGSGTSVTPVGSPAMEVIEHGNGDTGEEEELYYVDGKGYTYAEIEADDDLQNAMPEDEYERFAERV